MKRYSFCTIVTKSHLSWALALNASVKQFDSEAVMYILVTDVDFLDNDYLAEFHNTQIIYLKDIETVKYAKEIIEKYRDKPNFMRWSLKSILISSLLEKGFEKVIYCDCDIHFYNDYNFLWIELDSHNVLITPHWINPYEPENIGSIHGTGLFNGGFIGVSIRASHVMEWWAKACLYRCDHSYGYVNVDQGYLDLMPVYFDKVKILDHKGCNVAFWNANYLKRLYENDNYFIHFDDNKYPLIFYHFGSSRYFQFLEGEDIVFLGVLERLNSELIKYGYTKNLLEIAKLQLLKKSNDSKNIFNYVKSFLGEKISFRIYKVKTK